MVTVSQKWFGEQAKKAAEVLAGKSALEIGLFVEGQAKELAPVRTGRLRGSIMTASKDFQSDNEGEKIKPPDTIGEVFVGSAVEYAAYMEYGTGKTSAQPFLRPALDIAQDRALTIVEQDGKAVFEEYLSET